MFPRTSWPIASPFADSPYSLQRHPVRSEARLVGPSLRHCPWLSFGEADWLWRCTAYVPPEEKLVGVERVALGKGSLPCMYTVDDLTTMRARIADGMWILTPAQQANGVYGWKFGSGAVHGPAAASPAPATSDKACPIMATFELQA